MANITLDIDPKVFLPCYQPYITDYSKRYNVYWGGRGSGKSKFIIQKLLLKGLREKRLILLMRKQTNQLRDSVWRDISTVIREWNLEKYFVFNKTEFRVTCILNGTEFKCLGLDEPEKIKGFAEISDVLMDEVTGFTVDDVELIDGTLRSNFYNLPLQMYFTFNPISKQNFVYKYFGFDTGIVPPNTFILHTTYLDNIFLDESYLQRMEDMKLRNYNRWKIEALGEFVTLDKLIYENWHTEEFDHTKITGQLLVGVDFGFTNDPSVLVASILDETNKKIYVFREWGDTNKTNKELAQIITTLGFSKSTIIADAAEPKSIEEIRREGIYKIKACEKGPDSILHGIQRLQNYEIIVHPDCEGIICEFENYAWQKDKATGEYINKPLSNGFDHYLDSLRYSIQCADKKEIQFMSKTSLGLW